MDHEIILVPHVRIPVSAAGQRLGNAHHFAKYPAEVVERARTMGIQGFSRRQISEALGVPTHTIKAWACGRCRPAPTRWRLVPVDGLMP